MNNIKTFENFNNQDILYYIRTGDIKSVKNYIDSDSDLNVQDKYGFTPLIHAACNTTLIYAIKSNTIEIVKLLLEYGADVNKQDKYGNTALIHAASNDNCEVVEILLDYDADIDKQNNDGYTALIWAAFNNNRKMVELLLDYYADEFILNGEDKSFYNYLNDENKEYFLHKYPTSVYNAIYNNYKKSFTEFVKDYNIKNKK